MPRHIRQRCQGYLPMKIYSFLNVKGKILKNRTTKSFFLLKSFLDVSYVAMPHTQKCGWGNKTRGNLQIGESTHFAPNRNSPILQNWQQFDKSKIEMHSKTDWVSVVSDWVFLLLSLHHITDTIKPCLKEPPHIHKTRQDQVARFARAWQELEGLGRMIACRWSPSRVDDHLRAVVMPNINTETQIQIQIQALQAVNGRMITCGRRWCNSRHSRQSMGQADRGRASQVDVNTNTSALWQIQIQRHKLQVHRHTHKYICKYRALQSVNGPSGRAGAREAR